MKAFLIGAAAVVTATASPVAAKDHVVQMKNMGAGGAMVFEPALVRAKPGDRIRYVPSDPSHNAEAIATMLPAGVAPPPAGGMNKEWVLTVAKPGLYGVKCKPHYSMGMVGLVQVGNGPSANLAQAKAAKLPPFAAKRMNAMLAQVK